MDEEKAIRHFKRVLNDPVLKLTQLSYSGYEDAEVTFYQELAEKMEAELVDYGASKLILALDEFPDYVFKMPFLYHQEGYKAMSDNVDDWHEYGETELIESYVDWVYKKRLSNMRSFKHFCNAHITLCDGDYGYHKYIDYPLRVADYCAAEAEYSHLLEKKYPNIKEMFCLVHPLREEINGFHIYYAERAAYNFYEDDITNESRQKSKEYDKIFNTDMELDIIATFCECYGSKRTRKLLNFIENHNIYDLTESNVMMRENGCPVIVDFSDFNN